MAIEIAEETPAKEVEKAAEKPAEEEKPKVEAEAEAEAEAHPLEPGGKRFEQVYGKWKEAELKVEQERAERERLAAELAKVKKPEPEKPKEYTDDELDALEEDAAARGDRQTVRAVREYRVQRTVGKLFAAQQAQQARAQLHQTVTSSLMEAYPSLSDQQSELFKASSAEFGTLAQEYQAKGLDISTDPHATELAVSRALRKNPKLFMEKSMAKPKQAESSETYVEPGEGGKPAASPKGSKLTQRELDYCRRSGMDPKEYTKWKVERGPRA